MQYSRPPRACINLTESHEIPFLRQYILQLRRKNNTPFHPANPIIRQIARREAEHRLQVVPHFSLGRVERAKRELA